MKKDIDQLARDSVEKQPIKPEPLVWIKIERKLESNRYRRHLDKFRNLSIAAVFICLLACAMLMSLFLYSHSETDQIDGEYILEDLINTETHPDGFYASVIILNDVFAEAGMLE